MTISFTPIGIIHTPHTDLANMPIQPAAGKGIQGWIELDPKYVDGLKDLEGFSHIILLFHLHKSQGYNLLVTPYLDTVKRGLFATRAPKRPNPIGLSVVKLVKIDGNRIEIENVDVLDGTPLLDIKPYIPVFDEQTETRFGWLEKAKGEVPTKRSDERFAD
ncbi:MAG: tRNA (N6-threonylcarbamoyladenosine(37)-N6)-methyltransferase TrmO [Anaerolineae bacterium]|nr:tRNA (N6-threonylcarbamoyladenosine(37)-N6)-methyltransferase TrmO [Anaerolineae bacterium]